LFFFSSRALLARTVRSSRGQTLAVLSSFGVFWGATTLAAAQAPQPQGPAGPISEASTPVLPPSGAPRTVILCADGHTRTVSTHAATIGDLLREQQATLAILDRCSLPLYAPITNGLKVVVTRVSYQKVVERFPLPGKVVRRYSPTVSTGTVVVKQDGKPGEIVKKFAEVRKNGVLVSRKKVAQSVTEPTPKVVVIGLRGYRLASRGAFDRSQFTGQRVLTMHSTGYYGLNCGGDGRGLTRLGWRAGYGIVAVDPRVIPLRTRLFIEGYGYAVAGDTGGAIKGSRIDLGFNSMGEARRHGRKRVRVYVL
jgi:3D (Asp-Asp-Asp) domain-containing protein